MANNLILRTIELSGDWQSLNDTSLIGTVTVSAPPGNDEQVLVRDIAEPERTVGLIPGEWHTLQRVDLSRIEVQGQADDMVTLVGGSW